MYTEPEEDKSSESAVEGNTTADKVSNGPETGLLEHSSQLVELLSNMPSVLELLSQSAQSSLDEQERQVEQVLQFLPTVKGALSPSLTTTHCVCP